MINSTFAIKLVLALFAMALIYGGDRVLGRLFYRSRYAFWVRWLRLGLWLGVLITLVMQISELQPLVNLVGAGLVSITSQIQQGLNVPIADLGKTRLSLSTLITAVFAAITIFIGARLLSQSVKKWLLQQSRIERGLQEAIATSLTYAIAILGFVIVLQTIGLDLSSLAVLAGVLGLGFGLGLQELASNFVSGLTLLFEQQLRVGDFVEIDGLYGTIERISIRSTILRTTDQRFIIVPNHQVFQKNVTNWSFESLDTRIHIPVHVAFGSDAVLVTETLLNAARMEARVLHHPAPVVWFKAFGESSYEFSLLVWINQPQDFSEITSALNFLIEQELHREGIEIPFPQRELRLRNNTWANQAELIPVSKPTSKPDAAATVGVSKDHSIKQSVRSLRFLLRQVSYFAHCSDPQLRVLIEQGYRRFFRQGQVICREGDAGDSFHIILKGRVEVVCEKLKQDIALLKPGDFFGEISLFTGLPRSATIKALEDTTLFVVDHRALQALLQNHQELAEQIAESLAKRQQVLKELGILTPDLSHNGIETPLLWIRQRIQTLFDLGI